jgi:hypothetical protein
VAVDGRQTNTFFWLGVSPAPVGLKGPVIVSAFTPPGGVNAESIRKSENPSSTPAPRWRSTIATLIACGPAVTF